MSSRLFLRFTTCAHPKVRWDRTYFKGTRILSRLVAKDIMLTSCRWHQDVKPKNILVIRGRSSNPYDVEFKLADLGLSHFQRTTAATTDAAARDTWGTREYGEQMIEYLTTLYMS